MEKRRRFRKRKMEKEKIEGENAEGENSRERRKSNGERNTFLFFIFL